MEDTRLTQPSKLNTPLATIAASPLHCFMKALAARYAAAKMYNQMRQRHP